jgi:hypothetical protein
MSGAIYHVSVSIGTKATSSGGGGSAGATAEYISRLGNYEGSPGEVLLSTGCCSLGFKRRASAWPIPIMYSACWVWTEASSHDVSRFS